MDNKDQGFRGKGQSRGRRPRSNRREQQEFDQRLVEIARVTRVMAGGKRMRFRACVVIGDRMGRVGMGVKKGADVTAAVEKAVTAAKKTMIRVPLVEGTIPHPITMKEGGAVVLLKPAPQGQGVIAGGPIRMVMELAGVKNISSKMMGSNNKIGNVRATIKALASLKTKDYYKKLKPRPPVAPVAEAEEETTV